MSLYNSRLHDMTFADTMDLLLIDPMPEHYDVTRPWETIVTLHNVHNPDIVELHGIVQTCFPNLECPYKYIMYWRLGRNAFLPIYDYLSLEAALSLMVDRRIYVVEKGGRRWCRDKHPMTVHRALNFLCPRERPDALMLTTKHQPMSSEDLLAAALDDSDFDDVTTQELEELYFRCTNNTVYVLDPAESRGDSEGMVRLFATPAGRALVSNNGSNSPGSSSSQSLEAGRANHRKQNGGKTRRKELRKTRSADLYREAATLLGLTCSLTDNCRCLECQSAYLECDWEDRTDTSLAAGTPVLLDHVLSHPLTCSVQ